MSRGNPAAISQTSSQTVAQPVAPHERPEVRKIELQIDADRDKIIAEGNAIKADRQKLKEASLSPDKANAEEIKKDIDSREARIKDLKKEIKDKKEERYLLMNGKQKDEPRRNRRDAK